MQRSQAEFFFFFSSSTTFRDGWKATLSEKASEDKKGWRMASSVAPDRSVQHELGSHAQR